MIFKHVLKYKSQAIEYAQFINTNPGYSYNQMIIRYIDLEPSRSKDEFVLLTMSQFMSDNPACAHILFLMFVFGLFIKNQLNNK